MLLLSFVLLNHASFTPFLSIPIVAVPTQGQELYSEGQVSHFAGYFHMRGNWLVERRLWSEGRLECEFQLCNPSV